MPSFILFSIQENAFEAVDSFPTFGTFGVALLQYFAAAIAAKGSVQAGQEDVDVRGPRANDAREDLPLTTAIGPQLFIFVGEWPLQHALLSLVALPALFQQELEALVVAGFDGQVQHVAAFVVLGCQVQRGMR